MSCLSISGLIKTLHNRWGPTLNILGSGDYNSMLRFKHHQAHFQTPCRRLCAKLWLLAD